MLPRRERLKTLGIVAMLIPGALTPITASGSRVAVMAHAMGFVVGFLAGYVFFRRIHPSTLDAIDRRSRVGLVVSVSLVGAAFAMAVAQVHSAGA